MWPKRSESKESKESHHSKERNGKTNDVKAFWAIPVLTSMCDVAWTRLQLTTWTPKLVVGCSWGRTNIQRALTLKCFEMLLRASRWNSSSSLTNQKQIRISISPFDPFDPVAKETRSKTCEVPVVKAPSSRAVAILTRCQAAANVAPSKSLR